MNNNRISERISGNMENMAQKALQVNNVMLGPDEYRSYSEIAKSMGLIASLAARNEQAVAQGLDTNDAI